MSNPYISIIDGKYKTGYEGRRRISVKLYGADWSNYAPSRVPVTINSKRQTRNTKCRIDKAELELLDKDTL